MEPSESELLSGPDCDEAVWDAYFPDREEDTDSESFYPENGDES